MILRACLMTSLSAALALAGCGGTERDVDLDEVKSMAGGELKETTAVSGTVFVVGVPAEGVNIYAYSKSGGTTPVAQTRTKLDGTYCWTTHVVCDGLPIGEYKLAFAYIPKVGKGKDEGEDLFKGKYRNPTKNDFTLVVGGAPQTGVNYELEE